MTVAEAIESFLKGHVDARHRPRAATRAEILSGVSEGTPNSRANALHRLTNAGKLRRSYRRSPRGAITVYVLVKSPEWSAADQRLVEEYEAREREATVARKCMRCRQSFSTTQAYRLCDPCRRGEIASSALFVEVA